MEGEELVIKRAKAKGRQQRVGSRAEADLRGGRVPLRGGEEEDGRGTIRRDGEQ